MTTETVTAITEVIAATAIHVGDKVKDFESSPAWMTVASEPDHQQQTIGAGTADARSETIVTFQFPWQGETKQWTGFGSIKLIRMKA